MAGAILAGVYSPPPAAPQLVTIREGFSEVTMTNGEPLVMVVTLRRSGDTTEAAQVPWEITGGPDAPVTTELFEDTVLPVGEAIFPAGIAEVPVPITFAGTLGPSEDRFGVFSLFDPVGVSLGEPASFPFRVNRDPLQTEGPDPGEEYPEIDGNPALWSSTPRLSQIGSRHNVASAEALEGLASAAPGDAFVLTGPVDGEGGTFVLSGEGTTEVPITLRGNSDGGAEAYPELSNCTLRVTGRHVNIAKLALSNVRLVVDGGERVTIEENWLYGPNSTPGALIELAGGSLARDVRVRFNRLGGPNRPPVSRGFVAVRDMRDLSHPRRLYVYRNHIEGVEIDPTVTGGVPLIQLGREDSDTDRQLDAKVHDNLVSGCPARVPFVEVRCANVSVEGNTIEHGPGGHSAHIRVRHGGRDGRGTRIVGNLVVTRPGGAGDTRIQVRDAWAEVLNNWRVTLADGEQPTLGTPLALGMVELNAGNLDADGWPGNASLQPAGNCYINSTAGRIGGNRGWNVVVGLAVGTSTLVPARDHIVAPAAAGRSDRNTQVTLGMHEGTDLTTAIPEANIDRVPRRWLPGEVGPQFGAPPQPVPEGFSLGPDVGLNWAVHHGSGSGTVEQLAEGVRVKGGPGDEPTSGIRLYAREPIGPGRGFRVKLIRHSVPTVSTGGVFSLLGIVKVASGGASPAAALPATSTTVDTELAAVLRGWRVTFGNTNTASPSISDRLRLNTYDGAGNRTQLTANEALAEASIGVGVERTLEVTWANGTVTAKIVETGASQSWTDPSLAGMMDGYPMIYVSAGGDLTVKEAAQFVPDTLPEPPPEPEEPDPDTDELPTPLRTLTVGHGSGALRYDSLQAAYNAARAGDEIVLNNTGSVYPNATYNRNISGVSAALPVVIRAQTVGGATLAGASVGSNAQHLVFYGLKFNNGGEVQANNVKFLRCTRQGSGGGWTVRGSRFIWAYGLMVGLTGIGLSVVPPAKYPLVYNSRWRDFTGNANGNEGFRYGGGNQHTTISVNGYAERVLMTGFEHLPDNETVSIKSCDNRFRHIVLDKARRFNIRHGQRNTIEGILIKSGSKCGVGIRGKSNVVNGVETRSGTQGLMIEAGDCTWDQWVGLTETGQHQKRYVIAEDTLLIAPKAHRLVIGATTAGTSNIGARRTILEANQGANWSGKGDTPTIRGAASRPRVDPIDLSDADVGPGSAWRGLPTEW